MKPILNTMKPILKSTILPAITGLLILSQSAFAQNRNNNSTNTDVSSSNKRFWEANLPGGNYMVALDRISAINTHSYYIEGLLVHEVNIQINGAGLVRFYAFEVIGENNKSNIATNITKRAKELINQNGKRVGVDTNTSVHKEYAVTTHSLTVEYRLFDKGDIDGLYNSLKRAWRENRGRSFTIK